MGFESPNMPSPEEVPEIEEKKETGIMLSSEKLEEEKERWHTIEGVKDYFSERTDVYLHLDKSKYNNEGIKEGQKMSQEFSDANKALEQNNYENVLRLVETKLGDGLIWREDEEKSVFVGEKDINEHRWNFDYPKDLYTMPENEHTRERLREMADVLAEKKYEKKGDELEPTNYEEISVYLNNQIKSWELDENDSSVTSLKDAIQNKNYPVLADQIDLSSAVSIKSHEMIKGGDKDMKKVIEDRYHTGDAQLALLGEVENLRKYRRFLREGMKK